MLSILRTRIRHLAEHVPATFYYAVAVTENLDPQLALHIQQTAPPVRFGAVEMAVAFDLASGQLAYFQGTSLWGLFYCDEMRREIIQVLS